MNPETRFLNTTRSTNDDAFRWATEGAGHGCAIVARQQESGRGRLGRPWFSPAGKNLYCSTIVRPKIDACDYPKLTLVAGLAVAEFLESKFPVSVGLKWPNDIIIRQRKCGGILCESSLGSDPSQHFGIIGIGLNVNLIPSEIPVELSEIATSLVMEGCEAMPLYELFEHLRKELLRKIDEFEQYGFSPLLKRWRQKDIMYGKEMEWVNRAGKRVLGTSLGPDKDGVLRIVDRSSVIHEILSGDVTLARISSAHLSEDEG